MTHRMRLLAVLLVLSPWMSAARAIENEGQADLDKATELKLAAETLDDLNRVVNLCQSAIDKGLDASNGDFAKKLLSGTLIQRASVYAKGIFDTIPPDARWPRLRRAAIVDLERAIKADNSSPEPHLLIARLQVLPGGDEKRALEAINETIKLAGADNRIHVKALFMRGAMTEDKDKRLADYSEAIKLIPSDSEALRARGVYYLTQNKPDMALTDLDAAAKADPKQAEVHEARGLALIILKKFNEAVKAFDKVVDLEPDDASGYLHRGRAYFMAGDPKAALDDLNQADMLEPSNSSVLLLRARVHQQAGDTPRALADIDAALVDGAALSDSLSLNGALAAASGDFREAISDVQELRKIAPKHASLAAQLGVLRAAAKQPRKAIDAFSEALELDAKSYLALRGRADAYLNVGQHEKAIADYELAIKVKADDPGMLNNLAWVLATSPEDKLRDGKRAQKLADQAARMTEYSEAYILSTLAATYAEQGDWDSAIKYSQMAVDKGGLSESKDQLAKELAGYKEKKPWRELQNDPDKDDDAPPDAKTPAPKLPPGGTGEKPTPPPAMDLK